MDRGQALLDLLEAKTRALAPSPFRGCVSVGVRTDSGFRFWTYSVGPAGRGRSSISPAPPEAVDALVCLTRRDLEAILAGRPGPADPLRRFSGDPAVLRRFVRTYVDPPDALSIRCRS